MSKDSPDTPLRLGKSHCALRTIKGVLTLNPKTFFDGILHVTNNLASSQYVLFFSSQKPTNLFLTLAGVGRIDISRRFIPPYYAHHIRNLEVIP